MFWIVIWFLMFIGWIAGLTVVGFTLKWFGIGFIIMLLLTVPFVYRGLAVLSLFLTFVDEGKAKIIVRGDEFDKALMSWKDHHLDKKTWDVVEGEEEKGRFRRWFGGLRFYGIPPFQKVLTYHFRWSHLHEDGTIGNHDEWIDYVLLKMDVYVIELPLVLEEGKEEASEDINGMPMGISVLLPISIVNPYQALFLPRRWLPAISGVIQARLRVFVARYRYKEDLIDMTAGKGIEEIQEKKGLKGREQAKTGEDLWEKFWEELKKALKKEGAEEKGKDIYFYGALIRKQGAGILKINPSPDYRRLTTLEYETNQDAKRITITAEAEGKASSQRVRKPTWEIAKDLAGIKKEDKELTQDEIKKTTSYLEEAWSNYLEGAAIRAVKATDKIIVTEGKGIGRTVGRDVAREMIRRELSTKKDEEDKESKESKEKK